MDTHAPLTSALRWNLSTFAVLGLLRPERQMTITYERLVAMPATMLGHIVSTFDPEAQISGLAAPNTIALKRPMHVASGNPNRFAAKRVEISEDDEWRKVMKQGPYVVVGAVTWPIRALLRRMMEKS